MEDFKYIQIVDADGSDVGIINTDMTDEEMRKALDVFSDEDMDIFEKFEEYSAEIGKRCYRFFIDETFTL